ncbi:hypothetical protein PV08_05540 [Exophiala spinifera]|uniref:Uncharacterized protein n=1 Tax=Exophiala spinifera TaxID=91928 RepID=A0A0D2BW83_9EURO|nr:uncharacterized protein PV08_05540 [Exophiala spinifera]KIW15494.1 hypothetical protein PV08_05540 [Exophiala spinifera]
MNPYSIPRANARNDLPPRPADAPWTASRCKRILRQVTNFVNRLERWHSTLLAAQGEGRSCQGHVESSAATDTASDWLSTARKKKRPLRTYSSRNAKTKTTTKTTPETPSSRRTSSRYTLRTPRSNGVLCVPPTIQQQPAQQSRGHHRNKADAGEEAMVDNGTGTERHWLLGTYPSKEHEILFNQGCSIMSTFLVATASSTDPSQYQDGNRVPSRRGARSLFDMSLDKICREAVEQQRESDASHDGNDGRCDIVGSFFQEMEDFFGNPENGWPSLRAAVRTCGIYMITRITETGILPESMAMHFLTQWSSPLVADFQRAIRRSLLEARSHKHDVKLVFDHLLDEKILKMELDSQSVHGLTSMSMALQILQNAEDPICAIERLRFRNLFVIMGIYREPQSRLNSIVPQLLEAIFVTSVATSGKADRRALLRGGELDTPESYCTTISDATIKRLTYGWSMMVALCIREHTRTAYRPLVERISKQVQTVVELDVHLEMTANQRGVAAHVFLGNLFQSLIHHDDVDLGLLASLDSILSDECFSLISGPVIAMILYECGKSQDSLRTFLRQLLEIDCGDYRRLNVALTKLGVEAVQEYAVEHAEQGSNEAWTMAIIEAFEAKQQRNVASVPGIPSRQLETTYTWDPTIADWIAVTPSASRNVENSTDSSSQGEECAHSKPTSKRKVRAVSDRRPLAPLSRNSIHEGPYQNRRRSEPAGLETQWDGDFQYKRVKRAGRQTTATMKTRHSMDDTDESVDELSLLT